MTSCWPREGRWKKGLSGVQLPRELSWEEGPWPCLGSLDWLKTPTFLQQFFPFKSENFGTELTNCFFCLNSNSPVLEKGASRYVNEMCALNKFQICRRVLRFVKLVVPKFTRINLIWRSTWWIVKATGCASITCRHHGADQTSGWKKERRSVLEMVEVRDSEWIDMTTLVPFFDERSSSIFDKVSNGPLTKNQQRKIDAYDTKLLEYFRVSYNKDLFQGQEVFDQ